MNKEQSAEGIRYRVSYRDSNLYVNVFDDRVFLSIENSDEFLTLSAMSMVEELMNSALSNDYDLEDLAGLCFSASLRRDDLPRLIHDAIMYHLDGKQKEIK